VDDLHLDKAARLVKIASLFRSTFGFWRSRQSGLPRQRATRLAPSPERMPKHSRSVVAGAFFVLAIAALALIGMLSPSYQKCAADQERDYGQNEQPYLHKSITSRIQIPVLLVCEGAFIEENNGTLTALATIAIAAFTLTLWRATTEQGRLTRDSIELGNREFAATHRPRIRVAYIKLGQLQSEQAATAEIWAINIGDGDAEIFELGVDIFVRRIDMAGTASSFVATPTRYSGIPPIAPGQQANINIKGSKSLSSGEIAGITGSPNTGVEPWLHLCAVGTIHYLDANRTHRLTSFFRIYNPTRLRFMRASDDDEYAEWEYEA
jgi:hypothetical protein